MTPDAHARERAITGTAGSLLVEASAGTGKTWTLVHRILHLVLEKGPGGPPLELRRIAAITFTEKAAGEMKLRLREELERQLPEPGVRAERAAAALRDLETASITTIHSFAVGLLKERPVEAEMDPRFRTLDENHSRLLFRDTWDLWLDQALRERPPLLEKALRAGIGLENLLALAAQLRTRLPIVRELELLAPPTDSQVLQKMISLSEEWRELSRLCIDRTDRLCQIAQRNMTWVDRRCRELSTFLGGSVDDAEFAWDSPEAQDFKKSGSAGAAAKWREGADTVRRVHEFNNGVAEFCRGLASLPLQRMLYRLGRWIVEDFIPLWQERKRRDGCVEFDDQLLLARDLLRTHPSVRRAFQRQFATLLVDEFQDTDDVQLAIVLLLSCTNLRETDIRKLSPDPGRLFLVGDPKQSIYRFRGADIETYLEVARSEALAARGLELVRLNRSFRSVPSILRFVDAAFRDRMTAAQDGSYQPAYLPFGEEGARTVEPDPPSVWVLPDAIDETDPEFPTGEFAGREASRIALLIAQILDGCTRSDPGRTPSADEIAILVPTLTKADLLEDALREAGVSYVLEGGKFYYARTEVSSAISVLRAIANPNDRVALYAALRSIFFGLSDQDILKAHVNGTPLDYLQTPQENSALRRPLSLLRDLHLRRHERPASETFGSLLAETGVREVLSARPGGLQSLANLGKLERNLRSLQEQTTFTEVVELVASMDEEAVAESESRIIEEGGEAVRIMTIHKAKGLDFKIVLLAGLGQHRRRDSGLFLASPHRYPYYALAVGGGSSVTKTYGWKDLEEEEKKREEAELLRLLYVAMTRARDRLILSTHGPWAWSAAEERWERRFSNTRLEPLADFLLDEAGSLSRIIDSAALDASSRPPALEPASDPIDPKAALREGYAELRDLLSRTRAAPEFTNPSEPSGDGDSVPADDEPWVRTARRRGIRLGRAFHEAMETVRIDDPSDLPSIALRAGTRHSLGEDAIRTLEEMLRCCLASDLFDRIRRAVASGGRVLRELPYSRRIPSSGAREEGQLDLLFREGTGWYVVDYKTDRIPANAGQAAGHFREKYARQMRQYGEAVRALGMEVQGAFILLARTGMHIEIPL